MYKNRFNVVIDPLSDPEEKKKVMAELKRRVMEAEKPGAKWYSLDEVKTYLYYPARAI